MCKEEIKTNLEKIALQKTRPFCYSCYKEALPSGVCDSCGSDDLMRELPGHGVEYGIDWVIEELVKENLKAVNCEVAFEDLMNDCYSDEVKVGWLTLDSVDILKTMAPVDWDLAQREYFDSLEEDGEVISFDNGSSYYWAHDLTQFVEENLEPGAA